ncbi:MAG: 6-carboxytetrahydropterin synthase, partial [Candidatus Omnitrophica bacterium]|nr:6-carboxytetrahydropterin synthase [Candidatus Omnitrophota bacterium]
MFEIKVKADFSAAHNLREYEGKCERLHGHNWAVEAVFRYKTLDRNGLAV